MIHIIPKLIFFFIFFFKNEFFLEIKNVVFKLGDNHLGRKIRIGEDSRKLEKHNILIVKYKKLIMLKENK